MRSISMEEKPLVKGLSHGTYEDDDDNDEENVIYEAHASLLKDSLMDSLGTQGAAKERRIQMFNVSYLSLAMMFSTMALPLLYSDIDVIWRSHYKSSNMEDVIFICYAVFLLTYFLSGFITPLVLPVIGSQRGMIIGALAVCPFISVHFFPGPITMLIAYILMGLFYHLFYTSRDVALNTSCLKYSMSKVGGRADIRPDMMHFYSYSNAFALGGPFWRTLLLLYILEVEAPILKPLDNPVMQCGSNSCASDDQILMLKDLSIILSYKIFNIQILFLVFLIVAVFSLIILTFCVNLPHRYRSNYKSCKRTIQKSLSKLNVWSVNLLVLMPMFLLVGLEQGIAYQVLPNAFLGCVSTPSWANYTIIIVSGLSMITAMPIGALGHFLGVTKMLFATMTIVLLLLLVLFLVSPTESLVMYIVVACLWGVADVSLQTNLSVLVSVRFKKRQEAVWSTYHSVEALGLYIVHILRHYACVSAILVVVIAVACFALITYISLEIKWRLQERESKDHHADVSSFLIPDSDLVGWLPGLNPFTAGPRSALLGGSMIEEQIKIEDYDDEDDM